MSGASPEIVVTRAMKALQTGVQRLQAPVAKGFQRGSKMLGFPTANMEIMWDLEGQPGQLTPAQKTLLDFMNTHPCGIYYGWCQVPDVDETVHKAAVSIGWNPTFKDVKQKVIEPWILHEFDRDFYGAELRLLLCGYVREEIDFQGNFELLVKAIKEDGEFCAQALDSCLEAKNDAFFLNSGNS
ncbi:unnamed protein product [Amoebophrya sp. A120]|nr:unnamed protein product [Amoebophrya sp. A120]|eukprot:GSA120T00002706001.1